MKIILYAIILILGFGNIFQYYKIKQVKRKYNVLDKEKSLYENILESLPVAVFVHRRLEFVFVNKSGLKVFKLSSKNEIIGKSLDNFVTLDLEVIGEERIKNALEGKPFEVLIEEYAISKSGEIIAIDLISMPMDLEGETVVLNVSSELNQREELENLKRKVAEEKKRLEEVM